MIRKHTRSVALIASALLLAIPLAACETSTLGESGGFGGDGETHAVTYEVTGSATAIDVTYENENGDVSQEGPMVVPWRRTVNVEDGAYVYISAQNQDETGAVTCRVLVDGVEKEANTSSGAYTICTASGIL